MMPRPPFPVLSATSCSIQSASRATAGGRRGRTPRFHRDHEQRAVEVGCARHGQHRGRVRAVEYRQAELPEARREHQRREARAPHPAHDGARQPVAPRHVGKAGEVVPLRQRRAGRVFPSQEVHTAAKHNEPSRPSGPAVRLARRPPVPPLSRLTRILVAIAPASFLAIVLAYLRTPADRAGRTLAAAALIGVAVAIIGVWFTHSLRANRRYAALLENEVASQTRSLMDSLAATAAAERNLRLVMDAVPDAIVVVDRAATILEANEPARGMGAIPGTTQRPSLFDVVNPDAIGVVQEKLGAAFEGDVQHLEVPLIRADSSHGIAALLYAPVRDGSKITRVLILARDVTDQRRSESQYQQAEKLAALGQPVSGVAHETSTQAAIISGFAQTLLLDELKPEHRDMLQMMYDEATRIGRITSSLLAFARAGGKQRGLADLNGIARRTFALRSYYLSTLNITVALDLDPSEPKIWADASELQQMLLNLLINAEQALVTVERARTITVRTRADESDTRLEIADSGPGIRADLRTRIFDPFFTMKPEGVGTGLGLSICYGIARDHGGRIWVESEPAGGARFCVLLPRDQREEARVPAATPEPAPHAATGRLAVLVVDDEVTLREALLRFLQRRDIHVEGVADGWEAIRLLEQRAFDVIISDVRMPGMSGREFLERLRRDRPELVARLVFSTGDAFTPETATLLKESGVPAVAKPFDFAVLERVVREVAGRATASA